MPDSSEELLQKITGARPANEAEVETKILLHLFRLLGYTDVDRADKPSIPMFFGRERQNKIPDFVIYSGRERTIETALITVEAKAPNEALEPYRNQAISYAAWAGTPFLLMCNGETVAVAHYLAATTQVEWHEFQVCDITRHISTLRQVVGRDAALLYKETVVYLTYYLPKIGDLSPSEFLKEYLLRLERRFEGFAQFAPLDPSLLDRGLLPSLPIHFSWPDDPSGFALELEDLLRCLSEPNSRILLSGAPGSGKSTLCRRLTHSILRLPRPSTTPIIPIFINASNGVPSSLQEALANSCAEMGVRQFPNLFAKALDATFNILILDGLDEVCDDTPETLKAIDLLLEDCEGASILFTSRPHDPDSAIDFFKARDFRIANVCQLSDEDLAQVLSSLIRDREQLDAVLQQAEVGKIPDLHSPLIALMVARVANSNPKWTTFSTYDLYINYIEVLSSYYNSPNVRGVNGLPNSFEILNIHSSACEEVLGAHRAQVGLSLGQLQKSLERRHGKEAVVAWVNCGLVTSLSGRVSFSHQSFLDFGLAHKLISRLRSGASDALDGIGPSQGAYALAGTALTEADEKMLLKYLNHLLPRVRRRACKLLRYCVSSQGLKELKEMVQRESSHRVWGEVARILMLHGEADLEELSANQPKNRVRKLAYLIRKTTDPRSAELAFTRATRGHSVYALSAFNIAISQQNEKWFDKLIQIYQHLSTKDRKQALGMLAHSNPIYKSYVVALLLHLLRAESDAERLVVMLSAVAVREPKNLSQVRTDLIQRLGEAVRSAPPFSRRSERRAQILVQILQSEALGDTPYADIVDALQDRVR